MAVLPGIRPHAVMDGIADCIVGDIHAVVPGQLILPVRIAVGIGYDLLHRAQSAGGVGILPSFTSPPAGMKRRCCRSLPSAACRQNRRTGTPNAVILDLCHHVHCTSFPGGCQGNQPLPACIYAAIRRSLWINHWLRLFVIGGKPAIPKRLTFSKALYPRA